MIIRLNYLCKGLDDVPKVQREQQLDHHGDSDCNRALLNLRITCFPTSPVIGSFPRVCFENHPEYSQQLSNIDTSEFPNELCNSAFLVYRRRNSCVHTASMNAAALKYIVVCCSSTNLQLSTMPTFSTCTSRIRAEQGDRLTVSPI